MGGFKNQKLENRPLVKVLQTSIPNLMWSTCSKDSLKKAPSLHTVCDHNCCRDTEMERWSRMTGCCSGPATTPCPAHLTPLSPAYTQALVEPPHCWVNVVFGQESSALWAFRWIIYLILFIHAMKHKILYVFRGSESAHLYPF